MSLTVLLAFALTELTLSLSPGPAVFLTVSQSMRAGFKKSLYGVLGVMTGELIFFTLSALGLSAVLVASQTLFSVVKWLGAAYLVYLGLRMIFGNASDGGNHGESLLLTRLYRQGLFMQLANPKALLFFTALLPQFFNPELSASYQFVILGLISVTIQAVTLLLYGWLAARSGRWLEGRRFSVWLERLAGAFLVGAGVKLALSRR